MCVVHGLVGRGYRLEYAFADRSERYFARQRAQSVLRAEIITHGGEWLRRLLDELEPSELKVS